jgi:hypothetical protein
MIWVAKVVQKEERLGPVGDDVVGAHGHQVDADGVMAVHQDGDLDLGAYPVGGGHQHRVAVFVGAQVKEAPEGANIAQHAGAVSGFDQGADLLDKVVRLVDVDPGLLIGGDIGHLLCLPLQRNA